MRLKQLLLMLALLGFSYGFASAAAAQDANLSAELTMLTTRAGAEGAINVRYTLHNNGAEAVRVLKWGTPLEGAFNSRLFQVQTGGQEVRYVGRLTKRAAPTDADYVAIAAHGEASATLDLTQGYAIGTPGRYSVRMRPRAFDTRYGAGDVRRLKPNIVVPATTAAAAEFELTDARSVRAPASIRALALMSVDEAKKVKKAKAAAYQGCSATQQTTIDSALSSSASLAAGAYVSLAITPVAKRPNAPRYLQWFGAHTSARYDLVTDHFNKIQSALANETITFHCDCNEAGVYAYVYPDQPYNIHLCPVFWTAPLDGTDSQAGTIVHETSHFNVTAGTDDHAYGQTAAHNLAVSNPDNAIDNADNHEYFAENNPSLAMGAEALIALMLLVSGTIVIERWWRRRRAVQASE